MNRIKHPLTQDRHIPNTHTPEDSNSVTLHINQQVPTSHVLREPVIHAQTRTPTYL